MNKRIFSHPVVTALLLVVMAAGVAGCAGGGGGGTPEGVPGWVMRTPSPEGRLCAVGTSEPTYYLDDAKLEAAESARKELARSLGTVVNSIMIDFADEKSEHITEGSVVRVSSWATEEVLSKSEVLEYFFDTEGVVSAGKKGVAYALACMDSPKGARPKGGK